MSLISILGCIFKLDFIEEYSYYYTTRYIIIICCIMHKRSGCILTSFVCKVCITFLFWWSAVVLLTPWSTKENSIHSLTQPARLQHLFFDVVVVVLGRTTAVV
jgi:hypothetical protein